MPNRDEWLYRPASEGMCKYESLKDCSLDLADVARMNDILDVRAENTRRMNPPRPES